MGQLGLPCFATVDGRLPARQNLGGDEHQFIVASPLPSLGRGEMRKLALALFILVTAVPGASAGVREAVDAYDKSDYANALAACKSAAEQGDASCQNFLGVLFARGKGVPEDHAEAAKWYRRAAEQGNGYAQINLGIAYEQGHGVPRSDADAEKWYLAAANQHIPQAQLALGLFHLRVDHNEREAFKWFRLAPQQGLPLAQLALGAAY